MHLRGVIIALFLLLCNTAAGQVRLLYYDVDGLYDTIPSLHRTDTYTPDGQHRWESSRYWHKVEQIVARIDSLGLEMVALYGVENEAVVRDIAQRSTQDYRYLHYTLNNFDGLDYALLYHGDRIEPLEVRGYNQSLRIEARIERDTVTLLLVADPDPAEELIRDCRSRHPHRKMVVAGYTGSLKASRYRLVERTAKARREGHGTRYSVRGWWLRDAIWSDKELGTRPAEVVIRPEWLDKGSSTPLPTYRQATYLGGAGRNLPVWCTIE